MTSVFLLFSLLVQPVVAEDALLLCTSIESGEERLACFDRATAGLKARAALERENAERLNEARAAQAAAREAEAAAARAEQAARQARLRADQAARAAGLEPALSSAPPALSAEDAFGSEDIPVKRTKKGQPSKELREIISDVVSVELVAYDKAVVTLENGQIWRQLDSDNERILVTQLDRVESATVRKGLFGSHRVILSPLNKSFKAKRVK